MRYLSLLILIVLLTVCGGIPQTNTGAAPAGAATGGAPPTPAEATSGLGPSVGISAQPSSKIPIAVAEWYVDRSNTTTEGAIVRQGELTYLMATDGDWWYITYVGSPSTYLDFYVKFILPCAYTDLASLVYKLEYYGLYDAKTDQAGALRVYMASGSHVVNMPAESTAYTGSLALSSDDVLSGYVSILLRARVDGTNVTQMTIQIDELRLTFDPVTETRRSQYTLVGGMIRYEVLFEPLDYNTAVTLTYPAAWTFVDVNPDCVEASGVFSCLVPSVHTAIYSAPVLATANRASVFSDSFESGVTRWQHYWSPATAPTLSSEYVTVMDGAASLKAVWGTANNGFYIWPNQTALTSGTYWLIFSLYAAAALDVRLYRMQSAVWTFTTHTTTANAWKTFLVPCPVWSARTTAPVLAFMFYLATTGTVWFDGFAVYNSTVSIGDPITGSYAYLHPNGAVPAAFTTFNYNCTTLLTTNTPKVTDALGNWSITPTWATTPGTYTFYTCNPSATADSTSDALTVPFTTGDTVTLHFSYYMADGSAMFFHSFKTYVDGDRLPPETPWYTTNHLTVNLTLTDVWNVTVYQDLSLTVAEFVDIVTDCYWLTFTNQRDYSVNATIECNSRNWTIPDSIGPGGGFEYRLYTGTYTLWVWRADTGTVEPGFPVTQTVVGNWQVYTEKTGPGTTGGGGGLTVISPWVPVLLLLVVGFGAVSVYEWQKKRQP